MKKERNSSIELYRIILMILIIAHHYVVNSGIHTNIEQNYITYKGIYLLIFGAWGKVIINSFILITGYYMCKSKVKINKIINIILEVEFYKIIIYLIFLIFGKEQISFSSILGIILPVNNIERSFISGYIILLFLIPYLNILINDMDKTKFKRLLLLLVIVYTGLGTIPYIPHTFNYIAWFVVVYLIGAYIRIFDIPKALSSKKYNILFILSLIISIVSIIIGYKYSILKSKELITTSYYFLIDSNKIFAVIVSTLSFIVFINLNVKTNRIINSISKSVFGVLLIHASSDAMRQFLWTDLLHTSEMYYSNYIYIHSILSVIIIFIVCILIDKIRIILFEIIDKLLQKSKIYVKYKKTLSNPI